MALAIPNEASDDLSLLSDRPAEGLTSCLYDKVTVRFSPPLSEALSAYVSDLWKSERADLFSLLV